MASAKKNSVTRPAKRAPANTLIDAAHDGNLALAKQLLAAGADVNGLAPLPGDRRKNYGSADA
jgi:hypothetical protein